ncbi:MAG: TetR/AcrR family transcriptional regulator [Lachnospiraceae bacterium]|nr:TetR/AcrR family transcriptional regulator [Lachnospiraceae bacterium]
MRDKEKDAAMMAEKRRNMLEIAYSMFSEKSIDAVSMADIARDSGYGNTTLHRYFKTKTDLVVAVATWKWEAYTWEQLAKRDAESWDDMKASEQFVYFLDVFIDLYDNHPDMLRFNQFFNIYIRSMNVSSSLLDPYQSMITLVYRRFSKMYDKAKIDGSLRTDESIQHMFSVTLHLMLAAVTRFAVGLVYQPEGGAKPDEELYLLRDMLIKQYTTN